MVFKKFYILIIIQVALIVLNSIAISLTIGEQYFMITRYSLIFVLIIQTLILIFYTNYLNRKLVQFLESFQFDNYRLTFNKKQGSKDFDRIYSLFNTLIEQYEDVKIQKEKEYQFFSNVLQHIGIGLLGFDSSGKIILQNKAVLDLLDFESITNINKLERTHSKLPGLLSRISPEKNELLAIDINGKTLEISMKASIIKDDDEIIRLVSFQDIKSEIELKEIQSWQKLIRIINHEIINSLSPVNLLSSSIAKKFKEIIKESGDIPSENSNDIIKGLEAIHQRSFGLTQFVESYRNATHLPEPLIKKIQLSVLLENIEKLLKEEISGKNIRLSMNYNAEKDFIYADSKMIEQVIINLLRNAMQSCEKVKSPQIKIQTSCEEDIIVIDINDNGEKIPEEHVPNIFVPFFTTRKKGSGIGLSLSRQIMKLHNGSLELVDNSDNSKTFRIKLHCRDLS